MDHIFYLCTVFYSCCFLLLIRPGCPFWDKAKVQQFWVFKSFSATPGINTISHDIPLWYPPGSVYDIPTSIQWRGNEQLSVLGSRPNDYQGLAFITDVREMKGDSTLTSRFKRDSHNWSYTGPNGPSHWGGVCQTGKSQSPINIVFTNTREESFPPLSFGDNYKTILNFEAINNGHTLLVSTTNSTALPTFQGGGLDGKFVFQQLHFHWESEHQIDGQRAALEMHLVHCNSKYKDIGIASLAKDGIAVIAVLCDESRESDSVLEDFIQKALLNAAEKNNYLGEHDHVDQIKESKGKKPDEKHKLNYKLRDLLPANVDRWFRYEGSLTTPGCDETVMWTVILDRLHISSKSLDSFRRLQDKEGKNLTLTYRPIQALNGRTIYLQVDESYNEVVSDDVKPKSGGSRVILPNVLAISTFGIFALHIIGL